MTRPDEEGVVVAKVEGLAGFIRLNRPAALNALNIEMVRAVRIALAQFEADSEVELIVIEGAGGRAFCAGGDIRFVAASGRARDGKAETFWREEYALVRALATARKPAVALMDGITMGGGAGLGMHVAHRVVTDRTRFAMPEVGIGFVPDVGSTWRLARAPGETGRYMALTGDTFGAADVMHARLADHHVPADRLPDLRGRLAATGAGALDGLLRDVATRPEPGVFAEHESAISHSFRHDAAIDILQSLRNRTSDFARGAARTIASRSPRSLVATAALMTLARRAQSLEECLLHEFHAACRCLAAPDYYEGVRAAVIDKDRNPKWAVERLEDAGPADIAAVAGVGDPDFGDTLPTAEMPSALRAAH